MNSNRKLIDDLVIEITEQVACSAPKGDDWAEIGASELGGEARIRAVPWAESRTLSASSWVLFGAS